MDDVKVYPNKPVQKSPQQLVNEFKALDNDVDRWKWVLNNQDQENLNPVQLDNDDTHIWIDTKPDDGIILEFDDYIGWSGGIFHLLEAAGIKAESV